MGDLIYLAIIVAFFAITVLFVKACDSIIGPDLDLSDTERSTVASPAEAPVDVVDLTDVAS